MVKLGLVTLAIVGGALQFAVPVAASALPLPQTTTFAAVDGEVPCPPGQKHPKDYTGEEDVGICCPAPNDATPTGTDCVMAKYVNPIVNFLAAVVGIVVVGSVILGGIQYSASDGDPGKVSAAKRRIINSLLALAAFVFLYAFLQWVIPGGF